MAEIRGCDIKISKEDPPLGRVQQIAGIGVPGVARRERLALRRTQLNELKLPAHPTRFGTMFSVKVPQRVQHQVPGNCLLLQLPADNTGRVMGP